MRTHSRFRFPRTSTRGRASAVLWHSLSVAFLLLGVSTGVAAADSPWHRSVGGLEIYLGVLPAQMVQGHDAEHGGKKAQRGSHHIVVAIFDGASKTAS